MTSDERDFLCEKLGEIDNILKETSLSDSQRQMLLKERAEYEAQSNELNDSDEEESINEQDEEYNEESDTDNEQSECLSYESVYFKYCFEHCTNIDDVISTLESLKSYFEELKKEGHELTQPVDSGYCFIDKVCESE